MKIIGVIPARLKSTRLKEKMLIEINGKPLVWYTYINSLKSKLDDVIVATDSRKIYTRLQKEGVNVIMTSSKHKSGTDRVGEVSQKIEADFYINIQGDEPLIKPSMINQIIEYVKKFPDSQIVTLCKKISKISEVNSPDIVKVVFDKNNNALYFSRSLIPYYREKSKFPIFYKHIGIYCYRRDILKHIINLPQSKLEKIEKLEQLRFLENGINIRVLITRYDTVGVDTYKDLKKVRDLLIKN